MRTFAEIQNEVFHLLGNLSLTDTANANLVTSMKLRANMIQDDIENTDFMKQYLLDTGRFVTVAEYTTGTISITQNTKIVTGSGTAFTKAFKDRVLVVDANSDISYRIASYTSALSLTLDAEYIGDTVSGGTYHIFKDRYYLKRNIRGIMNMIDRENERALDILDLYKMSNPYKYPVDSDNGNGSTRAILLLSKDSYYSTGTVALTNGATAVTGTNTDWTSEMVGMTLRLDGDSAEYEITAVGSVTGLTIDRAYEGTTATADTYKINPPGQHIVQVWAMPEEIDLYEYDFRYKLPRLVNDNDVSLVTRFSDMALVFGTIWLMKDNEDVDPQNIGRYQQLYEQSKAKMTLQSMELDEERQIKPYYM